MKPTMSVLSDAPTRRRVGRGWQSFESGGNARAPLSRVAEALARFGRRDVVGKLVLVPEAG